MSGHPVLSTYKPKPVPTATPTTTSGKESQEMLGSLVTLKQEIEFVCSANDLYDCFVNPAKVSAWTRGPPPPPATIGQSFSLFGGNVTGEWKELLPGSSLVFEWRLKAWPAKHTSLVTITLSQGDSSTMLRLNQERVPVGIKDLTEKNWTQYYWNAIKGTFGYGAQF
jgi:activator of HSP90 ATPase